MFLGHFAAGFAAKKIDRSFSLGTAFLAAQFLDLLWPVFLLTGLEHARIDPGNSAVTPLDFHDYPLSHSLLGALIWSVLFGGVWFAFRRKLRPALLLGGCVISHWLLDFATHRPDLPLGFSGGPYVGLGLWNSLTGTIVVELGIFAAGVWLYLKSTAPKDRTGNWALWALVVFLLAIWSGNLFGPPPPGMEMVAVAGNAQWLIVLWGWWIDRHRQPV